jgi:hypothetical protein
MTRHDRRAEDARARHAGRLRLPIRLGSPAELHALVATGALQGLAVHVLVLHDAQCTPPRCICSPELEVRDLTAETLLEGDRLQAAWARSSLS